MNLLWVGVETGVIRGSEFIVSGSGDRCHMRMWIYFGVGVETGVIRGSGFIVGWSGDRCHKRLWIYFVVEWR